MEVGGMMEAVDGGQSCLGLNGRREGRTRMTAARGSLVWARKNPCTGVSRSAKLEGVARWYCSVGSLRRFATERRRVETEAKVSCGASGGGRGSKAPRGAGGEGRRTRMESGVGGTQEVGVGVGDMGADGGERAGASRNATS